MGRLGNSKVQIVIILIAKVTALFMLCMAGILGLQILPMVVLLILNILVIIWIVLKYECDKKQRDTDISHVPGHDIKDALSFGEVGIITYDKQYNATWINEFLEERSVNVVGKKLTSWIPEIMDLFNDSVDELTVSDPNGEYIYEIARKEDGQVLFAHDITKLETITERFKKDSIVTGLLQLDNRMEIQQYEDEGTMATINTQLRQPLVGWVGRYGMFIRRLRSDRFLVILNEVISEQVVQGKFDTLNTIRKDAKDIDVSITLSMSFARGTDDFRLLDTMVNDLLELAQSRGGDQVAVKKHGESVKYFGGNSEAREKRSKVCVRVMSQAIKEVIMKTDRVFIIGHQNMDFDCIGSALCMSRLAAAYGKEVYVVSDGGGIEPQLQKALMLYREKLEERHRSIDDGDAARMIENDDLLIAVDHHSPKQTGAPQTLKTANRIIVVDHHRRNEGLIGSPLLVYMESSASSVCELATRFLLYQNNKVNLSEEEATLMYIGILVGTNHFKTRTGSHTLEATAYLKNLGVDPITAENLLKEDFDDLEAKTEIMKYAGQYADGILIATADSNRVINRTLMSQVADSLLNIKDMEANFVIGNIESDKMAVSTHSKGRIDVQIIMENMHGGRHFAMAALQREQTMVRAAQEELKQMIDTYLEENKEDDEDESDTVKWYKEAEKERGYRRGQ